MKGARLNRFGYKIIYLLLFVASVSLFGLSFRVNPGKIEGHYSGKSFYLPEITISNTSDIISEIEITLTPLGQSLTGGPIPEARNKTYCINEYIEINPKKGIILEPGEIYKITPYVKLPNDYNFAGGYAMINVESMPYSNNAENGQTSIITTGMIGVIVIVNLDNPEIYAFDMINTSLENEGNNGFTISATVLNKGNTLNKFGGNVEIYDKEGNKITSLMLKSKRILPENAVNLLADWNPKNRLQGKYDVKYIVGSPESGNIEITQPFLFDNNQTIKINKE